MKRWLSGWYWRYRLELVMGRLGYVPLREYRKLQASYMRLAAEHCDCAFTETRCPTFTGISHHVDYEWNGPAILVSADFKRGIPCS